MRILHKRFGDYSTTEINKIKKEKCYYCEHFKGSQKNTKNQRGEITSVNICSCDYIGDTGHARYCRPEICPYSQKGTGIKIDIKKDERYVNYEGYCIICKWRDLKDSEEPCKDCIKHPVNIGTNRPLNWEKEVF